MNVGSVSCAASFGHPLLPAGNSHGSGNRDLHSGWQRAGAMPDCQHMLRLLAWLIRIVSGYLLGVTFGLECQGLGWDALGQLFLKFLFDRKMRNHDKSFYFGILDGTFSSYDAILAGIEETLHTMVWTSLIKASIHSYILKHSVKLLEK